MPKFLRKFEIENIHPRPITINVSAKYIALTLQYDNLKVPGHKTWSYLTLTPIYAYFAAFIKG